MEIKNKKITLTRQPEQIGISYSYKKLLIDCLYFKEGGIGLEETHARFKIIDQAEKDLNFTKEEAETIKNCVAVMKWGWLDREFMNFQQYIKDLEI